MIVVVILLSIAEDICHCCSIAIQYHGMEVFRILVCRQPCIVPSKR